MNNQELELKVKELISISNFFDMIIAVKDFEKEYKGSDFYKQTKMPIMEVIKHSKLWYLINVNSILDSIQEVINKIDFSRLDEITSHFADIFEDENAEILNLTKDFIKLTK